MALITFDPSKQSTVYFRCNRAGSKKFVFKNTDGTAYSLAGKSFKAFIKRKPQSTTDLIDLTCTVGGSGNNELTVSITAAQANVKPWDYYFELWESVASITYINAIAPFTNGVFDGIDDEDETITIDLAGTDVVISLPISSGGGGGTYTASNGLTMVGNDVQWGGTPITSDININGATGVESIYFGTEAAFSGIPNFFIQFGSSGQGNFQLSDDGVIISQNDAQSGIQITNADQSAIIYGNLYASLTANNGNSLNIGTSLGKTGFQVYTTPSSNGILRFQIDGNGAWWLNGVKGGASQTIVSDAAGLVSWGTSSGGSGTTLTPTAVKTANYSAAVGDFVPVDTTAGNITITLPTAPTNKSQIGVKQVIRGAANTVSVVTGGSDVYNRTGGGTTLTLTLSSQGAILQYNSSNGVWYVLSDDFALSQLDARFGLIAAINTWALAQTFSVVPTFTLGIGSATATTQAASDNSTKVATTAYVDNLSLGAFSTSVNGYVLATGNANAIVLGGNTVLNPGSALQQLRVSAAGTGLEYFTSTADSSAFYYAIAF